MGIIADNGSKHEPGFEAWVEGAQTVILFFYLFLNTACLTAFFAMRDKRLHVLEILTYWLFSSLLIQNYYALFHVNLKLIVITDLLGLEMAHFINRIVLEPLIIVWFLHFYAASSSTLKKAGLIAICTCLLTGMEWLADGLGVISHNGWKAWWSAAFWLSAVGLNIGCRRVFGKKLLSEVKRHEV